MSSDNRLIAARYVQALFELAEQGKQHDAVKADMLALATAVKESEALQQLIASPVITRENAERAITKVLEVAKANAVTKQFFALLARNRRLQLTQLVTEGYLERLAESRGELTVQVTSATQLSADEKKTLTQAIAKSTGKKVEMEATENPALLGGIQVRIGSTMLDNSVAGKLERLKQSLNAA